MAEEEAFARQRCQRGLDVGLLLGAPGGEAVLDRDVADKPAGVAAPLDRDDVDGRMGAQQVGDDGVRGLVDGHRPLLPNNVLVVVGWAELLQSLGVPHIGEGDFLATLPKASVIAGTAHGLDAVPLLAQRKIFWHPEFHAPFFKGYYRLVQERRAALVALETRDYAEIDRFCSDFGVTHFVFDRTRPLPPVVPARARLFENAGFLVTNCALGR